MSGETDIHKLFANMQPELIEGEFVFCTVHPEANIHQDIPLRGWFREAEGITLIVERSIADDEDLDYTYVSRMITLNVHSSLEAVGFIAAITSKLAGEGIGVNPISAYYHDHLFVPTDKANTVMDILYEMRDGAGNIGVK